MDIIKYKGVSYVTTTGKFKAVTKVAKKHILIGEDYATAKEAGEAYIQFVQNVPRELTATDNHKIRLFKDIVKFCETPKLIVEYYDEFKHCSTTHIKNLLRILHADGFVSVEKISGVGQPKLLYTKLKSYDESDYVPRAKKQALTIGRPKYKEPKIEIKPTIPHARVINFDDKDLQKNLIATDYMSRQNRKSPKQWVSGSLGYASW
jgi:hypothetical protein